MARPKRRDERHSKSSTSIEDEPGAEERFAKILKRALSTPPPRKREAKQPKPKKR